MPYPFTLPTTSSFSFSSSFTCESHPSLPLNASTHRGVVRDTLKKFKRLPPHSQFPALSSLISSLHSYLPYLFALDAGLTPHPSHHHPEEITVTLLTAPQIQWRPTLSSLPPIPGREPPRLKITSLEYDLFFTLTTLAAALTLQSRLHLHPLYLTTTAPVGTTQRQAAISSATKSLLDAASIYDYLSTRSESLSSPPPSNDISPPTIRALRSLALAEATLLAVLKDDPYPAIVLQQRNENDTEWMYKSPDIPKVRAHLFARLCLAAAEHASQAYALVNSHKINADFIKYLDDLRRTARAKACRFFGIDAELGGEQGKGIGWLWAGLKELGVEREGKHGSSGSGEKAKSSLMKGLKKEWTERREDKKIEKGLDWGADAGRLEERRVIEMLEGKWVRQNDTIMTQPIPPIGPLLAQMPTGREIHTVKPFQPPLLEPNVLEAMRAPPDRSDEYGNYPSSDEETAVDSSIAGAFPGTQGEYRTGTPNYY
ncbi:uncharacterized protein PODANS_1_9700 [Podospora anserina S mat+]|uniref:pH-response regulator protein palC n=1 Tax=Podospora anserina (strain S / ATCC MYA-4624 / DSM 980 / FGSC 10383) TaxID=515849 RepID=B2AY32_PODAN|nr:uncharacterized protein PODANS_1_9700 [Podospora anserina S mat+]CAP69306.1 unnamed protein product [Podospora anserina S mat+]CDP23326.1 Putative pH-response regulator protein palC [Podospora anserina S mat+]